MNADLIIYHISKLYTPTENPPVKGSKMSHIKMIEDAYVAVKDGVILEVGNGNYDFLKDSHTTLYDAKGMICLPGFIDSHSHLVHAGSRELEFEKLRQGIPYLDILKAGGGILGTVEQTRKASFENLYQKAFQSLDIMLSFGVTTLEAKSGYGLSLEHELKQLQVADQLNQDHPIHIVSTYMGAHALPKEYLGKKQQYINQLKKDLMLIKDTNLTNYVDVFCETGVFNLKETKEILETAIKLDFKIKLHSDEINSLGGTKLGIELKATSVDHLMAIKDEDIKKLASSNTIANLLPGTSFYLNKPYAPARKIVDQGCAVSISGDYNPGSCPTENFQFIMQLAANHLKMKPEEILNAVTVNAAYHLDLSNHKGSIQKGKDADLILLAIPNLAYLFYHFGINHVNDVFIKGNQIVKNKKIVRRKS